VELLGELCDDRRPQRQRAAGVDRVRRHHRAVYGSGRQPAGPHASAEGSTRLSRAVSTSPAAVHRRREPAMTPALAGTSHCRFPVNVPSPTPASLTVPFMASLPSTVPAYVMSILLPSTSTVNVKLMAFPLTVPVSSASPS